MDRLIYSYRHPDGRTLLADPRRLQMELDAALGDLGNFLTQFYGEDPQARLLAVDKLGVAVCTAFKLPAPFLSQVLEERPHNPAGEPPQGTLIDEWDAVLRDFLGWVEKNAPPAAASPT